MTAALAIVVAAFVAFLTTFPLRRYARSLGLLDTPNERSSHRVPTPRGGGAAIVLGAVAALLAVAATGHNLSAGWALLAPAVLVAIVGLLDDRFGLPPWVKFAGHVC